MDELTPHAFPGSRADDLRRWATDDQLARVKRASRSMEKVDRAELEPGYAG